MTGMTSIFGGAVLPLQVPLPELCFTDPAQDVLLALFRAVINDTLTPAFASLGLGLPVQDILPWEPEESLFLQRAAGWPLLLCYRTNPNEQSKEQTIMDGYTTTWNLTWCLGPMDANEAMRVGASRMYALAAMLGALKDGGYPTFMNGAAVLKSYFRSIRISGWELKNLFTADGTMYPSLVVTLTSEEMFFRNTDGLTSSEDTMVFISNSGQVDQVVAATRAGVAMPEFGD